MANEKHLEIVTQGDDAIRAYREENPETRLSLSGANLSGADLRNADLRDADLRNTSLIGARLRGADLRGADLGYANLRDADLSRTDLRGANLSHADLSDALLSFAHLKDADVSGTRFGWTTFLRTQLAGVVGQNESIHLGPSSLDVETLRNATPEFVRDCGFPDKFITHLPGLFTDSIAFYSCFISYSSKDEEFCKRLHSKLREAGLSVWFAPEDIKAGQKLHEQIDQQIRLHDKLLVVLSEHSMNSEWVETEIYHAKQREKREKKQVLFPISLCSFEELQDWKCLDGDSGRDMAREIRSYFIPDFSNWKDHDSFEESAKKLIEDLQRSEGQSPD